MHACCVCGTGNVVSPNKKAGDDEAGLSPAPLLQQQDPNVCYSLQRTERTDVLSFKCPMHTCYNCFEFYGNADTAELTKCLLCPRAFHTNCILPGSRFNSMCLLCPLHPDAPLPSHDVRLHPKAKKSGSGAGNECSLFWEQLAIPDEMPNAADPFDNHFKLQNHIKNDSESMAQNFIKIGRNDYDTFPEGKSLQGFVPEVACECKVDCGEDCLNRVLRIECCDSKIRSAGGSGDMCICAIGTGCTNRALQNRKYAKTEPFREFQMGWGLRAKECIAEGALVMEYVGEVIDHAEVQRRMSAQRINTPQDKVSIQNIHSLLPAARILLTLLFVAFRTSTSWSSTMACSWMESSRAARRVTSTTLVTRTASCSAGWSRAPRASAYLLFAILLTARRSATITSSTLTRRRPSSATAAPTSAEARWHPKRRKSLCSTPTAVRSAKKSAIASS